MTNKGTCKYCSYCKNIGRASSQSGKLGRKYYYCEHPKVNESTEYNFIGYGTPGSFASPLTLKTAKKWCPRRNDEGDKE